MAFTHEMQILVLISHSTVVRQVWLLIMDTVQQQLLRALILGGYTHFPCARCSEGYVGSLCVHQNTGLVPVALHVFIADERILRV